MAKKSKSGKPKRVIPFDKIEDYLTRDGVGLMPSAKRCTLQQFYDCVAVERVRRLTQAERHWYVAVPETTPCGFLGAPSLVWAIVRPLPEDQAPFRGDPWEQYPEFEQATYCGRRVLDIPIPGSARSLRLDQQASEDLAAALTLGHQARLSGAL